MTYYAAIPKDELKHINSYLDRNKLEMSLLSDAIGELEGVIAEADHYLTNGIAYLGVKSLKKKLEEELAEKALKSLEIKLNHIRLLEPLKETQ